MTEMWGHERTEEWILQSSCDILERKIRKFSPNDYPTLLTWALDVQKDSTIASRAGIKWAVAIIGTLAPEMFDEQKAERD